ncbi:hypothetical protein LTR27_012035 [Elasticomyces elasticus]|nr:hypothetical protein LTR27_012035 [Elasticomyces elasticus]
MNPIPTMRALAFRPRPATSFRSVVGVKRTCRSFADGRSDKLPEAAKIENSGPNMQQQEHVSEEAAKMAEITGGSGPDMSVGTPVQEVSMIELVVLLSVGGADMSEILAEEKDERKHAPQVMKDSIKAGNQGAQNSKPSTSRSFSTMARWRAAEDMTSGMVGGEALPTSMLPSAEQRALYAQHQAQPLAPEIVQEEKKGHKFPLPALPLPPNGNKDHRYDPVVSQVTNLLMRDGKKSVSQRNMAVILSTLRTAPPPTYILYLTLAIDSIAPLLRIRSQRGAAGGGVALQIPVPLGLRQRRRTAFTWILDAASKRKSRGSGNDQFAGRVAEEIIAVIEGRSGVWEKRAAVHRLGTTARSNLTFGNRGARR